MKDLKEKEKMLIQCENDLKKLINFSREFKKIEKNLQQLGEYYEEQYMFDVENNKKNAENFRILDQDSIWNVLSDQYLEKIKILKLIIKTI